MKMNSTALIYATTGTIWVIIALTLAAELSAPFKGLLVQLAGHHWVGKSVAAVAIFSVLYALCRRMRESQNTLQGAALVIASAVLGGIIIFSFFVWHFIKG